MKKNKNCFKWNKYLEKLVNEGKCDKYLDQTTTHPTRDAKANVKPPAKQIRINGIFVGYET